MNVIEYARFLYHAAFVREKIYTQKSKSVFSIDYKNLKKSKVNLLIFDVDDTLTWHRGKLEGKILSLLKKLSKGFKIAIFSNCGDGRRRQLKEMLSGIEIYIVPHGGKPGKKGFLDALEHFKTKPENAAMIGDRLGTDMWGAYAVNIEHRILVDDFKATSGKTSFIIRALKSAESRLN